MMTFSTTRYYYQLKDTEYINTEHDESYHRNTLHNDNQHKGTYMMTEHNGI